MPGPAFGTVVLVLLRGDALTRHPPLPVTAVPDFTALPMRHREDGRSTGCGCSAPRSWWSVRPVREGLGDLGHRPLPGRWHRHRAGAAVGAGPQGRHGLGIGLPMFTRFACKDFEAMAVLLEEAARWAQAAPPGCPARPASTPPTVSDPLIVLVIDELANLTPT
jgi:S-DNA-T family DNA segregation ATPase FtsK/SpoIIIE